MDDKKTRLPWRCQNRQQASDKAKIYNSREWKELRLLKLRTQPLCERCKEKGLLRSARTVHHIVPIETAHTLKDMRRLALDCGLGGLMSLCYKCHAEIHKEVRSHSKEAVKQREADRHERWRDRMIARFTTQGQRAESEASTENPAHPF